MAPAYHSAMGHEVGDLSMVNGNLQHHIFRSRALIHQFARPYCLLHKYFMLSEVKKKQGAPAHLLEDTPEVLSNRYIVAQ
eukprot:1776022-Karenia_brevis.AAC.1